MSNPGQGSSVGAQAAAGALWNTLGFALMSIGGYISAILLARSFGPVAYGVYGVVYSVLLASEQILRFGIPQALTQLIGGSKAEDQARLEATALWLGMGVNLAGFAVLWIAAPWLADWLNVAGGAMLFRIAFLDIPFAALQKLLAHILGGRRDFRASGITFCVYAISRTAGIALLVFLDRLTIESALVVNILGSLITVLVFLPYVRPPRQWPARVARTAIVASAVPIMFADVAMQCLLGTDLWLLSRLGDVQAIGLRGEYVAAMSLARGPNLLAFVLISILVPTIARAWSMNDRETAGRMVLGTTRFLLVTLLPACVLIAANAGELMALFFGEGFRGGAPFLAMLVFGQGFGFTALAALQAVVIGMGSAAIAARRLYFALGIAVALNLVLIPTLGAMGAGIAAVITFISATILLGLFVRHEVGVLLDLRLSVRAILVNVAVGVTSWFIPTSGSMVLVELVVLGLATLAVMRAVGLILPEDIRLFLRRSA